MVIARVPETAGGELLEISNALLEAALQGRTACYVTSALGRITGQPVFLLTRDFHVWAAEVPPGPRHPLIEEIERGGGVPPGVIAAWAEAGDIEALCSADRAVVMPAGSANPRLVLCPIRTQGDPSGYVMMAHAEPAREDVLLAAAQHLAVVAGLYLLRMRAFSAAEEAARSSLVYALVDGSFSSQDELVERATIAGYRVNRPHLAAVIESSAPAGVLARTVARLLAGEAPPAFVADLLGRAVVVIEAADAGEARRRVEALQVELTHELGEGVRAGVGSAAALPGEVARSYREAVRALRLVASPEQPVAFHDRARLFTLLDAIPDRGAILRYCRMILGPLSRPAGGSAQRLRETLEALAEHGYNQAEAARALRLHKNTVRYQVGRIAAVAGLDLGDPRGQLEATLALQAERFLETTEGGR